MKNVTFLATLVLLFSLSLTKAQKIADGETVDLNGLAVTFSVLNKESVTVGGKTLTAIRYQLIWSTTLPRPIILG